MSIGSEAGERLAGKGRVSKRPPQQIWEIPDVEVCTVERRRRFGHGMCDTSRICREGLENAARISAA